MHGHIILFLKSPGCSYSSRVISQLVLNTEYNLYGTSDVNTCRLTFDMSNFSLLLNDSTLQS